MDIPKNTQMPPEFWEEILRARRLTPERRFQEGCELVNRAFMLMEAGIRGQFPEASDEKVRGIRRERLARIKALDRPTQGLQR